MGLLAVAFRCLLPTLADEYKSFSRWSAAEKVSGRLGSNPFEVLVLDAPTRMLPEKRKELIKNPNSLFGKNYDNFLEFTKIIARGMGRLLMVNPDIFTTDLLADMGETKESDGSPRQIIEETAVTFLRSNLPHDTTTGQYDPSLSTNKYYEKVAMQTKDGILAAFKELVDKSIPERDKQYRDRIALLGGLSALEILFVDPPAKGSNRHFLPLLSGGR